MNALWPIALITFKEGIRNRALYGITLLALLLLVGNLLISNMVMQEVGKVAVDMALSAVSLAGLLIVLFVGINLLAKDLDRRTIYMVLSRPISRAQYLAGKYMGIALLLAACVALLGFFAVCSIATVKMASPGYFERFSWGMILLAMAFALLSLLVLMAVSFFFSTLSSSSFTTLVLTIITYIIGHSLQEVKALVEMPGQVGIQVSPLTVKVVQGASYLFPNFALFDLKAQAAHALALPVSYIGWVSLYGFLYIGVAIFIASLIFGRRQFP